MLLKQFESKNQRNEKKETPDEVKPNFIEMISNISKLLNDSYREIENYYRYENDRTVRSPMNIITGYCGESSKKHQKNGFFIGRQLYKLSKVFNYEYQDKQSLLDLLEKTLGKFEGFVGDKTFAANKNEYNEPIFLIHESHFQMLLEVTQSLKSFKIALEQFTASREDLDNFFNEVRDFIIKNQEALGLTTEVFKGALPSEVEQSPLVSSDIKMWLGARNDLYNLYPSSATFIFETGGELTCEHNFGSIAERQQKLAKVLQNFTQEQLQMLEAKLFSKPTIEANQEAGARVNKTKLR